MAKKTTIDKLLGATNTDSLITIATSTVLIFFVFLGAFFTTEAMFNVFAGKDNILMAVAAGGEGGAGDGDTSNLGYSPTDKPSIADSVGMGTIRGKAPEIDSNGNTTGKGCQLADTNCDGVITKAEWTAWESKTIQNIRDRCDFLRCRDAYCDRNPWACQRRLDTRSYIYGYGSYDLYSSFNILKTSTFDSRLDITGY